MRQLVTDRDAHILMVVLMVLMHLMVWVQLIMHLMVERWRLELHKVITPRAGAHTVDGTKLTAIFAGEPVGAGPCASPAFCDRRQLLALHSLLDPVAQGGEEDGGSMGPAGHLGLHFLHGLPILPQVGDRGPQGDIFACCRAVAAEAGVRMIEAGVTAEGPILPIQQPWVVAGGGSGWPAVRVHRQQRSNKGLRLGRNIIPDGALRESVLGLQDLLLQHGRGAGLEGGPSAQADVSQHPQGPKIAFFVVALPQVLRRQHNLRGHVLQCPSKVLDPIGAWLKVHSKAKVHKRHVRQQFIHLKDLLPGHARQAGVMCPLVHVETARLVPWLLLEHHICCLDIAVADGLSMQVPQR
mmetsp:Transcript_119375/g.207802  ORF Transcript_119375/g.207802 Transcript_119375/m.207802 type:complete len:353 (+) Transcript_119375:457-1515(+)